MQAVGGFITSQQLTSEAAIRSGGDRADTDIAAPGVTVKRRILHTGSAAPYTGFLKRRADPAGLGGSFAAIARRNSREGKYGAEACQEHSTQMEQT